MPERTPTETTDRLNSEPVVHSLRSGRSVSVEKCLAIHALHQFGKTSHEIAKEVSSDYRTVEAVLTNRDVSKDALKLLMADDAIAALSDWRNARNIAAAQGKHAPAKDWLLHAGVIEPIQQQQQAGSSVTVVIGIQGQPVGQDNLSAVLQANSIQVNRLTGEE